MLFVDRTFIGPTVGSTIQEYHGFECASTVTAGIFAFSVSVATFSLLIIIIILIKHCSLTRVKLTALYTHLMTKTTLTYISNKQNLKFDGLPLSPIKQ